MKWSNGFDLRPSVPLLCLALVLGIGAVSWVWLRGVQAQHRQGRLARLCAFTLFLCFDLVLFGAFTRLSDSGLGCPDWPGCYGFVSPLGAGLEIDAAHQLMPQGPVSWAKAWIEMIHRYAAMTVGFLILIMFIETWREALKGRHLGAGALVLKRATVWCASLSLLWVMLQGLFGALTVTSKLFPAIVSMHLLGGMTLLVLLVIQWRAYAGGVVSFNVLSFFSTREAADPTPPTAPQWPQVHRPSWGGWLILGACALGVQLALGAWVSTNYAVLACQSFPLCQAQWWPEMNFSQGFELWRPLGLTSSQVPLVFQALTAIHYTHRLMAYVVFVLLGILCVRVHQSGHKSAALVLLGLLLLQFLTGLSNVVLGWPMIGAILHVAGASALVITMTWMSLGYLQTRRREGSMGQGSQSLHAA